MKQSEIIERLAEVVNDATEKLKVMVPSTCYYARHNEHTEDTIEIINPSLLARLIQELADELRQNEVEEGIIQ